MSDHKPPCLSVVIPAYNRSATLLRTLESVQTAASNLEIEVIVVDDGSTPPLKETIQPKEVGIDQLIRQPNQGLLFARLTGLAAARGQLVMFLDSDDLISADKIRLHVESMQDDPLDVTYTDTEVVKIDTAGHLEATEKPSKPYRSTTDATDFFLNVQPAPHAPVFRTAFIRGAISAPQFPPKNAFNPVAEIWFYHKASVVPARVKRLPGPHSIIGQHSGERLTDHWEKLGIASLSVMEHFLADTPPGPEANRARGLVAARALAAWRRLPNGMPRPLQSRYIAVWRAGRTAESVVSDSPTFNRLATLLGPLPVAWILRRWRNAPYRSIQTIPLPELRQLMRDNPPPTLRTAARP